MMPTEWPELSHVYEGAYWIEKTTGRMVVLQRVYTGEQKDRIEYAYLSERITCDRTLAEPVFLDRFVWSGSSPCWDNETQRWLARNYGEPVPGDYRLRGWEDV
jgi:hypothetical protein